MSELLERQGSTGTGLSRRVGRLSLPPGAKRPKAAAPAAIATAPMDGLDASQLELLDGEMRLAQALLDGGPATAHLLQDLLDLVQARKERDALRLRELVSTSVHEGVQAIRTHAGTWYRLTTFGQIGTGDVLKAEVEGYEVRLTIARIDDRGTEEELLHFIEKGREPLFTANLIAHRKAGTPLRFLCRKDGRLIPV